MKPKYFKCEICGKIVAIVKDSPAKLTCCNQEMVEVNPKNIDDTGALMHLPTFTRKKNSVTVKVGNNLHPSAVDHHIEWISLLTNRGFQIKYLKPIEKPIVSFNVDKDEEIIQVSSYCNLHGLFSRETLRVNNYLDDDCECAIY